MDNTKPPAMFSTVTVTDIQAQSNGDYQLTLAPAGGSGRSITTEGLLGSNQCRLLEDFQLVVPQTVWQVLGLHEGDQFNLGILLNPAETVSQTTKQTAAGSGASR